MSLDTKFYRKILQRRLPAMMALFLVCSGLGIAFAMYLPTTYKTGAKLLLEAPQIADVGAEGITDGSELLEVIQQRLMTRSNLIDIANKHSVAGALETTPDAVVEEMRERTDIQRIAGRGRATLLIIEFTAHSPRAAAGVVNEYVTLILRENSRQRAARANVELEFFEQEVERLGETLSRQSEQIVKFKNENADALPDGMEYRLSRQALLQERLARAEREIETLRDQRASVVNIYETTGRIQAGPEIRQSPEEEELNALQDQLQAALSTYSDTHPRINTLRARIKQQEALVAAQRGGAVNDTSEDERQAGLYELALAQIDSNIESREDEIRELSRDLDTLANAIARTPSNGIALDALERDMNNFQSQYNAAVNRLNLAQMTERIEISSKGQRITVIEQASVPTLPDSPNRPMIAIAGVGTGLMAAIGLFFLLEILNSTVRRPAELVSKLGVTPLASIPYMETKVHRRLRRVALVLSFSLVVVGTPLALWALHTYYLPLDLIMDRAIQRLGLG